jgi:hypothetical protein
MHSMISGLDSASVKIVRAAEHIDAIRRVINSLASTANSYEIVKDADGKEKFRFLIQPPPQIAVLAGEVVYQLRSALDHLVFDLVKRNQSGITLPANWDARCDFPLWLRIPDDQIKSGHTTPPLPYNCFTKSRTLRRWRIFFAPPQYHPLSRVTARRLFGSVCELLLQHDPETDKIGKEKAGLSSASNRRQALTNQRRISSNGSYADRTSISSERQFPHDDGWPSPISAPSFKPLRP